MFYNGSRPTLTVSLLPLTMSELTILLPLILLSSLQSRANQRPP